MRTGIFALNLLATLSFAAEGEPSAEARFQTEVWPLLENSCLRCHGPEKQKGDLRLDSREAALKGGESGPALVPGKPAESLMLRLARHAEADRKMPPKDKLRDAELTSLERWIAEGAPWPARAAVTDGAVASGEKLGDAWSDPRNPIVKIFAGQRLDLWSLKPIADAESPPIRDLRWPRNPIDHFILAELETVGRQPAPEADARTLCRRLYFDLTGLPPTPEQLAAFLADTAPGAYERLVDALLASDNYGEHWARMWLDVVRYSDSNGFDWDEFRPQAWRFRDYVIRSLNTDKPFNRFVVEQLAGDELVADAPRDAGEQDCLIATGFLRLGPHDNSAAQFGEGPRVRAALMNDLVETTGSAFLGLTLTCCRCHHHKFDPISQADYYRLRAFFEGVQFADTLPLDLGPQQQAIREENEKVEALVAEKRKARDAIAAPAKDRLRADRFGKLSVEEHALLELPESQRDEAAKKKIAAIEKKLEPADGEVKAAFSEEEKKQYAAADAAVQALKKKMRAFTTGLLMADAKNAPAPTHVLFQGDITKPRETVVPGFLSALDPNPAAVAKPAREGSSGRRSALAEWLVSEKNPLVARVLVNRVWLGHFGEGLVATPNDFGLAGARPSQPELLDWLAREFMRDGWSLKKLHRLIVTSATYRQGAPPAGAGDAGLFLGRKPQRVSAEVLRDSMLAVSGRLLSSGGGAPVWPELPQDVLRANPAVLDDNAEKTKGWYPSPAEKQGVRSIYLVQKRTLHVPMMETFDQPDNALSCPRRIVSTVAPQALTLLNSPFAADMAQAFAARVQREAGEVAAAQIERSFVVALQRPPDVGERAAAAEFLAHRSLREWCRVLLNLNEFAYID